MLGHFYYAIGVTISSPELLTSPENLCYVECRGLPHALDTEVYGLKVVFVIVVV